MRYPRRRTVRVMGTRREWPETLRAGHWGWRRVT